MWTEHLAQWKNPVKGCFDYWPVSPSCSLAEHLSHCISVFCPHVHLHVCLHTDRTGSWIPSAWWNVRPYKCLLNEFKKKAYSILYHKWCWYLWLCFRESILSKNLSKSNCIIEHSFKIPEKRRFSSLPW